MQHLCHAVRSECSTCHSINLRVGVGGFLSYREGYLVVAARKEMLSLKLGLPSSIVFYLGSQSGRLTFMIEVSAKHRLLVSVQGNVATYGSPQALTVNGYYILVLNVYITAIECQLASFGIGRIEFEARFRASQPAFLHRLARGVYDVV